MMQQGNQIPGEMRVFLNHIYELSKGIRHLALHTMPAEYLEFACNRLTQRGIPYIVQRIGNDNNNINLFFGQQECINVVESFLKPLNTLSPEEDFILGAMLGYDICIQCRRLCQRKEVKTAIAV